MSRSSRSISEIPTPTLAKVKAVFFDIDDTFSGGANQHRILPEAYNALWRLHAYGIPAIPVTGRPAGWCDMIARMWPVPAVVGENGAFYQYIDGSLKPPKLVKKYLELESTRKKNAQRLERLHRDVLKRFKGARVASDQNYREFDLAIDYCEDVSRWTEQRVQELLEFCRKKGAIAKLSSIHVNAWFGKYDKLSCVRRVLEKHLLIDPHEEIKNVVYIGDSPNDEPFFEHFPFSVGVANVRKFLDKMNSAPAYLTDASGGVGFAEFVEVLLKEKIPRKGIE